MPQADQQASSALREGVKSAPVIDHRTKKKQRQSIVFSRFSPPFKIDPFAIDFFKDQNKVECLAEVFGPLFFDGNFLTGELTGTELV
jgi:hypothetical protein